MQAGPLEVGDGHDVALREVPADEQFLFLCLLLVGGVTRVAAREGVTGVALRAQAVVEAQVVDDPRQNRGRSGFEHRSDGHPCLAQLAGGPVQQLLGADRRGVASAERQLN